MTDAETLERAKSTFATLCRTLDKHEWKYRKDEEKLSVECGAQGDDLPIEFKIKVDAQRMLVMLISHLPFKISEEKRLDGAIVISYINDRLVDGNFDYDVSKGHIFFRMTNSFRESVLDGEVFAYMLFCACKTIDEYNDKLLMISKGILSIEQFLDNESEA